MRFVVQIPSSRRESLSPGTRLSIQEPTSTTAYLLGELLNDYKVMIAQYTERIPVLKDDLDFVLWQYTGKGRINGINGYVDKSRFMGKHKLREVQI